MVVENETSIRTQVLHFDPLPIWFINIKLQYPIKFNCIITAKNCDT